MKCANGREYEQIIFYISIYYIDYIQMRLLP